MTLDTAMRPLRRSEEAKRGGVDPHSRIPYTVPTSWDVVSEADIKLSGRMAKVQLRCGTLDMRVQPIPSASLQLTVNCDRAKPLM